MPSGGARSRSGPQPDPGSGRSDRRGLKYDQLPSAGYKGYIPKFPLPPLKKFRWEYEEKARYRVFDQELTDEFRDREVEVWKSSWRTPQAAAWAKESWRHQVIAEYCRVKTAVEIEPEASAALIGQLHRFRDQIGLTPAGMKENGWQIAADEVAAKRAESPREVSTTRPTRRLRAVNGG